MALFKRCCENKAMSFEIPHKMNGIFVTGTDTGVGKTVVTGLLAKFLIDKGYKVITQKWIQTGAKRFSPDIAEHLRLMGVKKPPAGKNLLSPYIFKRPHSPHLAARLEGRTISIAKIERSFKILSKRFDIVIVEGTGGALVPINNKDLIVDIARRLKLPVLIVVDNRVGAINHAMLTIEAIKKRRMKIIGLIFNNKNKLEDKVVLRDNPKIIRKLTDE
jgi:dethiobiotin synthetase